MKLMAKISVVIMSLCLILCALSFSAFAAEEPGVYVETTYETPVKAGDTIVVEIKNDAMSIQALSVFLKFDGDLLWMAEMQNAAGEDAENNMFLYTVNKRGAKTKVPAFTSSDYDRVDSSSEFSVLFAPAKDTEILEGTIVTLYFEALADGVAEFVLTQEATGNDAFKRTETFSITLGNVAPSCDHATTKLVANNNGTHNVVCANADCGEVVTANEKCSGTDDGDHTTDVKCECGNTAIAGTPHVDENAKDHVCDVDGCTEAMGEHKSNAQFACQAGICEYCKAEMEATAEHGNFQNVPASNNTHNVNCGTCGYTKETVDCSDVNNDGDHACDVCGRENASGHIGGEADCVHQAICSDCGAEYGDIDPANHAGEKFFEDTFEDMSQHLVYCNKCGELWDSQNPSAPHEANEEGYCECGLFAVVQDFNGGQISTKPPYPEMTEEAWTHMVESQLGGFDVTSMSRFTHGFSIIVKDENIAMMNLMFVKEGYKLVGLAYDAEGTQRYNGEKIEKPTTLYYVWEPLHTHAHDHYDITETTHQSICSCGEILGEAKEHDYTYNVIYSEGGQPNTHHKEAFCVCGAHEMSDAEHTDANADGSCDECELHTCVIELVDGKPATCTEDGWYSYGYCKGCGTYYTYEAEREQFYPMERDFEEWKAGEGKIPATGHSGYYSFEFYVDGSFCTVEMSFYCTTCEKIVGYPLAYNDEGMLFTGAFCNRTGVLVKIFSFKDALPENCSWDNFELKGELPETPNFNNIWSEETAELIYGWATPLDPNNHWSIEVSYQDITDEQHTVYHPCCKATETVDHTFDETTHMCVCGKVETFTLTIRVLALDGKEVELTVPYGANLLEVLAKAAGEGLIPALGDAVPVNDALCIGINIPTRYSYFDADEQYYIDISENDTMPASDYDIDQEIIFTGWGRPDTDQPWGYQVEDIQIEGWYKVDGAWYFFFMDEETGWSCRAEGLSKVPYPEFKINGIKYEADKQAKEYAANQVPVQTFIDETTAWFLFDENGKFLQNANGMGEYNGATRYMVNGMLAWHPGLIEIGGEYYYFIGDVENGGNIAANGDTYITRNNGNTDFVLGEIYFFVNGKLSTKNGVVDGYYYENGQLMIGKGLVQLDDGRWIYVRSNGSLAKGVYYVGEQKWEFDENGYAKELKNGIIGGKYYVNGHVQYGAGLVQYENGYIYVCSNGQVVMGRTYWITNTNGKLPAGKYEFGADGKLLPVKDGIVEVEGVLYYYDNNHVQYGAGLVEIEEGVYIYVRSNGQLAIGEYWVTNHNDLLKEGKYTFGNDGKLTVN